MVRIYTCMLLLIGAFALHEHYKHLDLEYVMKETRRLTYMDQDAIYEKIENNKMAVSIIIDRYDTIFKNHSEQEAQDKWKYDYENDYADDFDRALITQTMCNILYKTPEKCDVGITWDHKYDSRDRELRTEFLKEVEETVQDTLEKVRQERESRGRDL